MNRNEDTCEECIERKHQLCSNKKSKTKKTLGRKEKLVSVSYWWVFLTPLFLVADHAYCRSPGDCICLTGYTGSLCNIDLDVCAHQSPCRNGATCTSTGPDLYNCTCAAGFTGHDCDQDVDYCSSSPCLNGATCTVRDRRGRGTGESDA